MAQTKPIILSTWSFGLEANAAGWGVLSGGGCALDAVQAAATVTEDNPSNSSVGYGGHPNELGTIQLDAAIIDGKTGRMGAVGALEGVRNPASVARKILEKDKHIFLVGDGSKSFALKNGFQEENLHTPESSAWYAEQLKKRGTEREHDTIGVLAMDQQGDMAVVCTTSGLGMKWAGRVGDSPIIGAGLYLDRQAGGAVGTGVGERAIEVCGAFAIVEFMRNGLSPQSACEKLLRRVVGRNAHREPFQLAYIALNPDGEFGGAAIQDGFVYAVHNGAGNEIHPGKIYGSDFQ